jgi:hypothetical protein
MKKILPLALASVAFVAGAYAAPIDTTGVTVSTDPAKAGEVEHQAQELAARDTKLAAAREHAAESKHKHRRAPAAPAKSASK